MNRITLVSRQVSDVAWPRRHRRAGLGASRSSCPLAWARFATTHCAARASGRRQMALDATLEPGKRGGRPCIRGLRITVYDVLSLLSNGMSQQAILDDFPELEPDDVLAVLAYAADREHKVYSLAVQ